MMKQRRVFRKHRMTALLLSLLLLCTQTIGFAASGTQNDKINLPEKYDPENMTFEERAAWVEANLEPVYSGPAQQLKRGEWLYTSYRTDVANVNNAFDIGKLETQMKFMCDNQYVNVTDFATVTFRATPYGGAVATTDYTVNDDTPNNIRVVYSVAFAYGDKYCLTEHWYTLHGHGAYDLYVVNNGDAGFVHR